MALSTQGSDGGSGCVLPEGNLLTYVYMLAQVSHSVFTDMLYANAHSICMLAQKPLFGGDFFVVLFGLVLNSSLCRRPNNPQT